MKKLLLVLLLVSSPAFAVDPECNDTANFHDPQVVYPSPDRLIDVCSPQFDTDGDAIPDGTPLVCILEVDRNGSPMVYATTTVAPGTHFVFAVNEKYVRSATVHCDAGATVGEVLAFTAIFPSGQPITPGLLQIQ